MSSSSDSELDMLSTLFNPIKALYTDNVKTPVDTALPLDNISKFEMTPSGEIIVKPEKSRVILMLYKRLFT